MTFVFIISAIAAVLTALLVIPLTAKGKGMMPSVIGLAILAFIVLSVIYYVTNLDRNWTALWPWLVLATFAGTSISRGKEQKIKGVLFLGSLAVAVFMLSAPVWNANEKYEITKMNEQVEIQPFDETKTPASVPPKFARNKMKKAFGQVPNTSYYELGNLQIQKVKDEYVYIAPVEFSGFFKWMNGDVTPGYFTMSATDSSDNPKFVKAEMSYTPSSFLHKNLERHMRMMHPTKIFYGEPQLEINEDGKPYYIRSYGKFISARNGFDVDGIIVVDPATGQTDSYKLDDVPAFIDGAVSPEAVSLQNSYFGNYVHGFINSIVGKKDVKLPSDEGTEANVSPIFGEDGRMYYFTDFTSPKEGVDSMLGYSLTDGRTGKATYYTGNLEDSYMDSQGALQIIEKKFIEKKWSGEMPVLYNFYGEASWLTPVLDSNGFLQNYFIVSAANPEISVYGNTPNEALKLYKTAIRRGGSSVDGSSNAEEKSVTGTVLRVFKERVGDFTQISFLLNNNQSYIVSSEVAPLAVYMQEGDSVQVKFLNTGELFLPVKEVTIQGIEKK